MITKLVSPTNTAVVEINDLRLYFSYDTLVALSYDNIKLQVDISPSVTTSKHIAKLGVKDYYKVSEFALEAEATRILKEL